MNTHMNFCMRLYVLIQLIESVPVEFVAPTSLCDTIYRV